MVCTKSIAKKSMGSIMLQKQLAFAVVWKGPIIVKGVRKSHSYKVSKLFYYYRTLNIANHAFSSILHYYTARYLLVPEVDRSSKNKITLPVPGLIDCSGQCH
jgi:hypothetical protein